MKKRILAYRRQIDEFLAGEGPQDWEHIKAEHLIQIAFFQHERLIHLIVTVLFALLEMIAFSLTVLAFSPALPVLCVFILLLLVPYIRHYYLLENEVQKMYAQYDRIVAKCEESL